MDGIPKFNIEERDGKFYVQVPFDLPLRQVADMAKRDPSNN